MVFLPGRKATGIDRKRRALVKDGEKKTKSNQEHVNRINTNCKFSKLKQKQMQKPK
jgi:hypothetical protein